jgi:acetyltransferase
MASWMGGLEIEAGEHILSQAGIATFPFPDSAARMFTELVRYSEDLKSIYETPTIAEEALRSPQRTDARQLIEAARANGRTILSEAESKELLAAYGIPVAETRIAHDVDAAVAAAEAIGYPVVVKLYSHTITHKTDVGGVKLDLADEAAVRSAYNAIETTVAERRGREHFEGVTVQPMIRRDGYELIIGSSVDPQFGPVLLFGLGGELVEVFRDRALGLPPLTTTLARRMMENTKVYTALKGVRGRTGVDMAALEQLMVRFSELVVEQPSISEIDINPLLASSERIVALDARVILHKPDVPADALPRPAIRPYPLHYVGTWQASDGHAFTIRPIRPEDETAVVAFHGTLSDESVYQRYFTHLGYEQRIAHERLVRVCFTDYDREIALVAQCRDEGSGETCIAGIGRLIRLHASADAEFALVVSDAYQGLGLGKELLRRLIEIGRQEGMERLVAEILATNSGMIHLTRSLGFTVEADEGAETVHAVLALDGSAEGPAAG